MDEEIKKLVEQSRFCLATAMDENADQLDVLVAKSMFVKFYGPRLVDIVQGLLFETKPDILEPVEGH